MRLFDSLEKLDQIEYLIRCGKLVNFEGEFAQFSDEQLINVVENLIEVEFPLNGLYSDYCFYHLF
jgi:hypothetical protein